MGFFFFFLLLNHVDVMGRVPDVSPTCALPRSEEKPL